MTRKDSEKEAERPHYYSQFWLDIAAGRKIIGVKNDEIADVVEYEPTETVPLRKPARSSVATASDGYEEEVPMPTAVVPPSAPEEVIEPELEELELPEEVGDLELPNILVDDIAQEEAELPEMDLVPLEEEEEEDYFDDEDEEEDEWGTARGRKKPKPGRQAKQPKKPKRERDRRGGF